MLFSPSTRGFYLPEIHGDAIPQDVVGVSAEQHAALLAAQAAGQVIAVNQAGQVVAQDAPPVQPVAIRKIRSLAFRERLSEARRKQITVAAVATAAGGDATMLTWLMDQAASIETDLDDPRVAGGAAAMLAGAVINQAEHDALLADGTPQER
jgi:hypothetical protein